MSDLRFKITDQSEEAIRARAAESVIWNENEARVPTRISDALWAAVRDRETLLGLLREARAATPDDRDREVERIAAVLRAIPGFYSGTTVHEDDSVSSGMVEADGTGLWQGEWVQKGVVLARLTDDAGLRASGGD
jgi:hypothetical protein